MEYYQRIRNAREDMDYKQYQFANLIGILPKTYNLYENGFRSIPIPVLNKILRELDISLDYILGLPDRSTCHCLYNIKVSILSENLKTQRKKLGYSQKTMASLLNCNQQTLSEYERGKLVIPLNTLKKFCEITNTSADIIAGRNKKIVRKRKIPN